MPSNQCCGTCKFAVFVARESNGTCEHPFIDQLRMRQNGQDTPQCLELIVYKVRREFGTNCPCYERKGEDDADR